MDHVLRGHNQFHVASDRDVQFVDLALTLGVFELPHPLFCDDINFGRIGGRSAFFEINHCAPGEDDHEDQKWDRAPGDFERSGAFDLLGVNAGAMTEAGGEVGEADEDQQGHHPADDEQENVESVHVSRHGGSLLWPQWKIIEHNVSSSPSSSSLKDPISTG